MVPVGDVGGQRQAVTISPAPSTRIGRREALKDGLSDTKHGMLDRTQWYEKQEAPKGTSLQSWLRRMKSEYEKLAVIHN